MSSSREALLSRFRATLQTRVTDLRALLEVLEFMPGDPNAVQRVLGEVHTLKGESRMLGLVHLADLAHAIEDRFTEDTELELSSILSAVATMHRALAESNSQNETDSLLREAVRDFRNKSGPASTPPASNPPTSAAPGSNPITTPAAKQEHEHEHEHERQQEEHQPQQAEQGTESKPAVEESHQESPNKRWVQVEALQLNALCDQMGDLATEFAQLRTLALNRSKKSGEKRLEAELNEHFDRCHRSLDACEEATWGLRLIPIEPTLQELLHHARRLAQQIGKEIKISVSTGKVKLERDVVEQLWDMLLHLVQNAVDHGLEPAKDRGNKAPEGQLLLSARSVGSSVVIEVEDDGWGIDVDLVARKALERGLIAQLPTRANEETLQLIFEHGFSTKEEVSEISGRGVGLDVVRRRIQSMGGSVEVFSTLGQGTRFSLVVPHAISRERVLVVDIGGTLYGLPSRAVLSVIGAREIGEQLSKGSVFRFRDEPLPLRSLRTIVGLSAGDETNASACVLQLGRRSYGLRVGQVVGEVELLRRPASQLLSRNCGIGSSALLDDGRLVLVLDLEYLGGAIVQLSSSVSNVAPEGAAPRQRRVLVVDDSPVVTAIISDLLREGGLAVDVVGDGIEALEYLEDNTPDLVLSDYEMPRMDGLQLLEKIRERSDELPVVMLTTRASVEDRRRASDMGANAYILKTEFENKSLLNVVRRFVGDD